MALEKAYGNGVFDGYDIEGFLKAIEGKNLSEIISFADREATAAWRRAYREKRKRGAKSSETSERYEQSLEELITFLRTALFYRPAEVDEKIFERFVDLRRKVWDEKIGSSKASILKTAQG